MTRENKKILIFVDTKVFADSLGGLLCQEPFNIKSTALHGDRSQEDRDRAFEDFKVGNLMWGASIMSLFIERSTYSHGRH